MTQPLFDLPGIKHAPPPEEKLSPDRKRTRRQMAALTRGQHPLSLALRTPLPLHTDAAPAGDIRAEGLRCGTCRFRELLGHHDRSHPKCRAGGDVRVTHGAGTDVRAWWPACHDYEPADGA